MISFKQFISEESVTPRQHTAIDEDTFQEMLVDHCDTAIDNARVGNYIYRGDRKWTEQYVAFDSSLSVRASDNGRNYYTMLMDTLPAFNGFPKRSKSLITSSTKSKAKPYGDMYRIYPHQDAKVGICQWKDIWDTEFMLLGTKVNFADLNEGLHILGVSETNVLSSLKERSDYFRGIDVKQCRDLSEFFEFMGIRKSEFIKAKENFYGEFVSSFRPEHMEMKWCYAKDLDLFQTPHNELWIEGKMLAERIEK